MMRQEQVDEMYYDKDDRCYECTGYGDDYYLNENGEWDKYCDECPYNPYNNQDED